MWAATSPESGRFTSTEELSAVPELSERLSELRSRGQGYIEVRLPNLEFPTLMLGFRNDHAVVHLLSAPERMSLLAGDATLPSHAEVEVPIMDELARFTGDFVMRVDRAEDLLHQFVRTGVADTLGEWCEL
ncbi:hypothetical protein [Streptomyces sp. NPDC047990]|uniref:hypothetical protein n=1 Tax=Streptomyces sp. NPDC047990 TaxID=3365496 RepID=UPI003714E8A8